MDLWQELEPVRLETSATGSIGGVRKTRAVAVDAAGT